LDILSSAPKLLPHHNWCGCHSIFDSYIRHIFDKMDQQINSTERIRLRLGHILNLGLEFAIASDILRLTVSPKTADFIIHFCDRPFTDSPELLPGT